MESNNNREKQTEEKPVNYKQEEPQASSNHEQEVSDNSEKTSENELEKVKKQLEDEKKGEKHKLYLYKGFHLCETCYRKAVS